MDVRIVSKLALYYSKSHKLKIIILTIGHKQYRRELFHKLCYSNF